MALMDTTLPDRSSEEEALERRRRMVHEQIRARGVRDPQVLQAMIAIPRERFLPAAQRERAFEDRALPIEAGQTISQPFIVAYMTELLNITPHCKVLEVGTGSGYQAAVLAQLAREIHTIERFEALREQAEKMLMSLAISNVFFHLGDGTLGWPDEAPFDRIIVTAAAPHVPPTLMEQLADQGRIVIPVGGPTEQRIVEIVKEGPRLIETPCLPCRFVRLVGKEGWPAGDAETDA